MESPQLLDDRALERSEIVANNRMNRERGIRGNNSYAKDIGFDPIQILRERLGAQDQVCWLDLCCGAGRALIEAGLELQRTGLEERVMLHGVDLAGMFAPLPAQLTCVRLEEASLASWQPRETYDLITCVHGLHYIGDKLGLIQRAVIWLKPSGMFAAHLDYSNLRLADGKSAAVVIGKDLRGAGFTYFTHRHLLVFTAKKTLDLPYRYLGADDAAGPNYTGQPAVNSYYRKSSR